MNKLPKRGQGVFTHSVRPTTAELEKLEEAAEQERTPEGLEKATKILEALSDSSPKDIRYRNLADSMVAVTQGDLRVDITAERMKRAFQNLEENVDRITRAYTMTSRVSIERGGDVTPTDQQAMDAVEKMARFAFSNNNAPACTLIMYRGKVLVAGYNRSYTPVPKRDRHGESEAFTALDQKIYTGIAQVLLLYRAQNPGGLDERTNQILDKLVAQGVEKDQSLRLDSDYLEAKGFFAEKKVDQYARHLKGIIAENLFIRDEDGNLDAARIDGFQTAMTIGEFSESDLPEWEVFDRVHTKDPTLKLTLYSSLEPCGRCMATCIGHGQIGRIAFGARDKEGGALTSVQHATKLEWNLGRVPTEIVGGINEETLQPLADQWQFERYPKISQQERI